MTKVIDFGEVALAGAFLKPHQFSTESVYPLRLFFCEDCFALQVIDKVSPGILFKDYFYFSSSIRTLRDHFYEYAIEVTSRFLDPVRSTVVEIGCNDGVLLKPLADQGIRTLIGVDPATNVVQSINDPRIRIINKFFTEEVAEEILRDCGKVDIVAANNVYAHIADIQGVTRAIRRVLSDDGVFIFEVHYLGKIIDEMQYDMIYHEHLYYYSLLSLEKHFNRYDMTVFDVKPVPIHAGSMRYYACKRGSRHSKSVSPEVDALRESEIANGFHRVERFARFAGDVAERKQELLDTLKRIKRSGKTIAGYGASGRANTILQYCGIDDRYLGFMIDDAPAKEGFYTPGSHLLIKRGSVLDQLEAPDYLLVFAWSFLNEIAEKRASYLANGGHMIVPLPHVHIIPPTGIEG
jgi:SAM-dependent methyltransferase